MSQVEKITAILEREGQISNFWCIHNHLTLRLAARIQDLKDAGYVFDVKRLDNKDTVYVLKERPALKQGTLLSA